MNEKVQRKKKKKLNGLDYYVIFSIASMILYTIVSQILAAKFEVLLDTLTNCFFKFFGGEILSACLIKLFKLRKEKKTEEEEVGVG